MAAYRKNPGSRHGRRDEVRHSQEILKNSFIIRFYLYASCHPVTISPKPELYILCAIMLMANIIICYQVLSD